MADAAGRQPKSRRGLAIIFVIALVGGGIALWEEVLEDRLVPKRFGVVVENSIYRSGQLHPAQIGRVLDEHEVDVVICLRDHIDGDPAHEAELQAAQQRGVEHLVFPLIGDGTGDVRTYAEAVAALVKTRDEGRRSLVHCAAGAYRTGGVIALYRMLIEGRSPDEVRAEMEQYDWESDDPILPEYLNANMPELVEHLIELGVLETPPDEMPEL